MPQAALGAQPEPPLDKESTILPPSTHVSLVITPNLIPFRNYPILSFLPVSPLTTSQHCTYEERKDICSLM